MPEDVAHIAFISPNAAFSAFAESVLSSWPDIRIHAFEDAAGLAESGLAPSVVACNFEFDSGFYESFAPILSRLRMKGPVTVLAIVRQVDAWSRSRCRVFGVDEVAVKPISPLHLGLRLAKLTAAPGPAETRRSAEIVPFPGKRRARHMDNTGPVAS
ncbi:MAG: hypothetical protein KKH72_04815 [Alphaproteobacteria bacterium]|nr:hypothetical protein [Alphaproteobacteria bacterium]